MHVRYLCFSKYSSIKLICDETCCLKELISAQIKVKFQRNCMGRIAQYSFFYKANILSYMILTVIHRSMYKITTETGEREATGYKSCNRTKKKKKEFNQTVKISCSMDSCFEWLSCWFLILFPLFFAVPTTFLQIQFTSYFRAEVLVWLLFIFLCPTESNLYHITFLASWFNHFRPNFSIGYSTQHPPNSPCQFFCALLVT